LGCLWQLAGHMHVLGCPSYMEDHSGALEEDIQAGLVPLPQLPKHKQVGLFAAAKRQNVSWYPWEWRHPGRLTTLHREPMCVTGGFWGWCFAAIFATI
jgi:hypothetical protein